MARKSRSDINVQLAPLEADMIIQVLLKEIQNGRTFFQPTVDNLRRSLEKSRSNAPRFVNFKGTHDISQFI